MISFWALFKWNKLTLSLHNRHMLILLQSQKLMPYYARPLVDQWLWLVPGFYIVCQLEQAKSTGFRLDECMCVTCTRFQGLHTRPGQKWKRWGPGSAAVCAKAQMSVSSGLVCMAWAGQRWIPATCKFHRLLPNMQTHRKTHTVMHTCTQRSCFSNILGQNPKTRCAWAMGHEPACKAPPQVWQLRCKLHVLQRQQLDARQEKSLTFWPYHFTEHWNISSSCGAIFSSFFLFFLYMVEVESG